MIREHGECIVVICFVNVYYMSSDPRYKKYCNGFHQFLLDPVDRADVSHGISTKVLTCVRVYVYVCVCVCIHIYIYIHTQSL